MFNLTVLQRRLYNKTTQVQYYTINGTIVYVCGRENSNIINTTFFEVKVYDDKIFAYQQLVIFREEK